MTTSNEAIAAAMEITKMEFDLGRRLDCDELASIIQKHYTAKDAEIEKLRQQSCSEQTNEQYDSKAEHARRVYYQNIVYTLLSNMDVWLGRSVRGGNALMCGTVEYPSTDYMNGVDEIAAMLKERDQLKARVAELEQMCRAFRYSMDTEKPFPSLEKLNALISSSPSSALTRLQELERKAKALDWYDRNAYKVDMSQVGNDQGWTLLHAIEAAMEKQK